MRHTLRGMLGVLFICVLACAGALAQGTSQINGIVKDSTGAVLPGVEVTATQTDTNQTRDALSDETGAFVLPSLPVGPYKVEATLPGFRTFVQTGIVLGVNQNPNITVVLEVGQVTEQVEVQANVTMVETRNLGIRQVIENQEILELPLNGRNATELILLQGGAVADGANSSGRAIGGGVSVSVTGLAAGSTTYTLDGAMHTNPFDNLNLPLPFPDSLQEFSVQSGSQNASNGYLGGAQVGAVTKSGTNSLHGSVFDFYRNDRFQARPYFDTTGIKTTRTRNQFGGTLGGPIVKNKVFFFGGYQRTTNTQNPTDSTQMVPTTRMLNGDFTEFVKVYTDPVAQTGGCRATAINNSGTGSTPGFLRLTDSPNSYNPNRFSKAALAIVHLMPQVNGNKDGLGSPLPLSLWADNKIQPGHSGPVGADECGRVFYSNDTHTGDEQIILKVDYQKSSSHQIFGRVMYTPQFVDQPALISEERLGFINPLQLAQSGFDNLGSFYTIGDTYLLSPNTINTLSLAVNRTAVSRPHVPAFDVNDVGINAYAPIKGMFFISNAGFSVHTGTTNVNRFVTNLYSLNDSLSMVRGPHQFSFGATAAFYRSVTHGTVRSTPLFSFAVTAGDLNSTGLSVADFLLGKYGTMRQSAPNQLWVEQLYIGLHAQDAWRVTPRFTVNAGVRWEPFFPQTQMDGHIYNFDYNRMKNNVKSQTFVNAPPGFYYPGDPGFQGQSGMEKNWNAFGPRVGFGWDPNGDGKMSIRASYGLSYTFVNGQFHFNTNVASPFGNDMIVRPTGKATLDDPWADFPGGPGFLPGVSPFPYDNSTRNKNVGFAPGGLFLSVPPDLPTTNIQSWNLTVQRELPAGIFMSLQYSGNSTHHLWFQTPLNPAIFVPGTGVSTGGCVVPDGKGGTHSLLVVGGTVSSLAAARTSNSACSSTANTNFRRILSLTRNVDVGPYVADLDSYEAGGTGNYNGLVVSVRRQATRNLNLSGNYTWSRCITDPGGLGGLPNVGTGSTFVSINGQEPATASTAFFDSNGQFLPGVTDLTATAAHREWNRSNCSSDRRGRLNTTAVVSTPRFNNNILRMIASGWRVSSIYTRSTGSFLEVAGGGDVARIGGGTSGQTAVQLTSDVYAPGKPHGPRAQYLNPGTATFVAPETGKLAPNHGTSNIEGPPTWQWDASIARTFEVREGHRVELRVEGYNVTNSFRPTNPSTNITGSTFGLITNSSATRDMQFALRYIF